MGDPLVSAPPMNTPELLRAAVDGAGIAPAFQPIVALPHGVVVGFEALARWPELDGIEPEEVVAYAKGIGGVDRFDRMCIGAAVDRALRANLTPGSMLLVNSEPSSAYVGPDDDEILARGRDALTLVFEITERGIFAHPRALLRKIAQIRADGFSVALDDVGVYPESLSLMDVISPDIVKLDMSLLHSAPSRAQARTLSAVMAHHERTNSVILAEGIENEDQLELALAMGAVLARGSCSDMPLPCPTASMSRGGRCRRRVASHRSTRFRRSTWWPVSVRCARRERTP